MSTKRWLMIVFTLLTLMLGACSSEGAPIFQVEVTSETTIQVGDSQSIDIEIIVANLFDDFGGDDDVHNYGLKASLTPADGPVQLVRLSNLQADAAESSISTSVRGRDNVFTTLEIACLEEGEAEVKLEVDTLELYDEATMLVLCVAGNEAVGDESDADSDDEATSDCEPFDSDINVGSIGQVSQAAAETGLIPEDANTRAVGQELRRMMEVTGEVCQSDLLALTSNGEVTPQLEAAIAIAVERIREQSE